MQDVRPQETILIKDCYYSGIIPIGHHILLGVNARTTKVKAKLWGPCEYLHI